MTLTIATTLVPLRQDDSGVVRVAGTRVTLDAVIHAFNQGASAETICEQFDALTLPDVYAVIAYYLQHREQVDAYVRERQRASSELRAQVGSQQDNKGIRERLLARIRQQPAQP